MSEPKPEAKPTDAAVHAIRSYLGGAPRAGRVPFGPRLIPDALRPALVTEIAAAGFALTFEAHEHEPDALAVAVLTAIEKG